MTISRIQGSLKGSCISTFWYPWCRKNPHSVVVRQLQDLKNAAPLSLPLQAKKSRRAAHAVDSSSQVLGPRIHEDGRIQTDWKNCLFIFEEMYSGKEYALFTTLSRRQRREVSPLNADSVWTDLVLAMANWASVTKNALNFIRRFNWESLWCTF